MKGVHFIHSFNQRPQCYPHSKWVPQIEVYNDNSSVSVDDDDEATAHDPAYCRSMLLIFRTIVWDLPEEEYFHSISYVIFYYFLYGLWRRMHF